MAKNNPDVLNDMTNEEIAAAIGSNRDAVGRDLRKLLQPVAVEQQVAEAREALQDRQRRILELIESSLLEGKVDPEIAREWRAIRKDISELMGLNAPARTVSTRVNIDADATAVGLYGRFLRAIASKTPDQVEEVFRFIANQPNIAVDMTPPARALPVGEVVQDFVDEVDG